MPRDSEDALHRPPNAQSQPSSLHLPSQGQGLEAGETRRAAQDQDLRQGSDEAISAAEDMTARADAKGACADGASALVAEAKASADVARAFASEAKASADEARAFASAARASADEAKAFASEAKASASEAKAVALVAIAGAEEVFPRQNGALEGGGEDTPRSVGLPSDALVTRCLIDIDSATDDTNQTPLSIGHQAPILLLCVPPCARWSIRKPSARSRRWNSPQRPPTRPHRCAKRLGVRLRDASRITTTCEGRLGWRPDILSSERDPHTPIPAHRRRDGGGF